MNFGVLYFDVDGTPCAVRGNVTYATGSRQRESVVGQEGLHGHKEIPVTPFIQMDVTDLLDGTTKKQVEDASGVRCTLGLKNGKTVIVTNATQINQFETDPIEGQFTARFEGEKGWEV